LGQGGTEGREWILRDSDIGIQDTKIVSPGRLKSGIVIGSESFGFSVVDEEHLKRKIFFRKRQGFRFINRYNDRKPGKLAMFLEV